MSDDVYGFYAAKRKVQQEKRKANKEYALEFLQRKGIPYKELNAGVHLRITLTDFVVDFYPSTGLYILKDGTRGRGIFNLWKLVRDKL